MSILTDSIYYTLKRSKVFYLMSLTLEQKEINKAFHSKKYTIHIYPSEFITSIETDGQIYNVFFKDETNKSYDLGFNFIKRNAKTFKFESKKLLPPGYY